MIYPFGRLFCVFAVIFFLLINCSDPMQKTYNPETFSQDLQELEEPNRTIIRNVFDRFERLQGIREVTGSETVMLPSLTFGEVLNNYKIFHLVWRELKKEEFKEFFLSKWAETNNPQILRSNISFTLGGENVPDPENNYFSRLLTIEHEFKRQLCLGGSIGLDYANEETNIGEIHSVAFTICPGLLVEESSSIIDEEIFGKDTFIFPGDKLEKYINNYKIPEEYMYSEDKALEAVNFSSNFHFALGNKTYFLDDSEFLLEKAPIGFRNEIDKRLNELENIVENSFSLKIWPHDSETINEISNEILNSELLFLELKNYQEKNNS